MREEKSYCGKSSGRLSGSDGRSGFRFLLLLVGASGDILESLELLLLSELPFVQSWGH